jgi:hypothetical protein
MKSEAFVPFKTPVQRAKRLVAIGGTASYELANETTRVFARAYLRTVASAVVNQPPNVSAPVCPAHSAGMSACTGTSALDTPVRRNRTMSRKIVLLGRIMHLSFAKLTCHDPVNDYLARELRSLADLRARVGVSRTRKIFA